MTPELTALVAQLRANAATYTDMPINRLATTLGTSQKIAREAYWRAFEEPPVPSTMDTARFKRLVEWLKNEPGAREWGRQRLARAMHIRESAVPEIYRAAFGVEMKGRPGRKPAAPPPPEPPPNAPKRSRIHEVIAALKQRDPATLTVASVRREFNLPASWAARAIRAAHGDIQHDATNWKLEASPDGLSYRHKDGMEIARGATLEALRHDLIAPSLAQAEADGVLTARRREIIGDELPVLVMRYMGEVVARAIYGDEMIDDLRKGTTVKKPERIDLPALRPDEIEALRLLARDGIARAARHTSSVDGTIAAVAALVLTRHRLAEIRHDAGGAKYAITEQGKRLAEIISNR